MPTYFYVVDLLHNNAVLSYPHTADCQTHTPLVLGSPPSQIPNHAWNRSFFFVWSVFVQTVWEVGYFTFTLYFAKDNPDGHWGLIWWLGIPRGSMGEEFLCNSILNSKRISSPRDPQSPNQLWECKFPASPAGRNPSAVRQPRSGGEIGSGSVSLTRIWWEVILVNRTLSTSKYPMHMLLFSLCENIRKVFFFVLLCLNCSMRSGMDHRIHIAIRTNPAQIGAREAWAWVGMVLVPIIRLTIQETRHSWFRSKSTKLPPLLIISSCTCTGSWKPYPATP
jgi:hypothetical protein